MLRAAFSTAAVRSWMEKPCKYQQRHALCFRDQTGTASGENAIIPTGFPALDSECLYCVYRGLDISFFFFSSLSLMSCWAAQRKQRFYQWDYYTRQVKTPRTHGLSDCLFVCLSSFHFPPLHLFQYFSFAASLTKIVLSSVSIEIKRMLKY